jgi:hypothetical protein
MENQHFFNLISKKTKFNVKEGCLRDNCFIFFTKATNNVGFLRNLVCAYGMLRCNRKFSDQNFLTFLKCFFDAGSICSYGPN